jgi:peptide-methionine (S)-S-oxide reductase
MMVMEMERATFAAGCFWGVEYAFRQVEGVTSTKVGYMGGSAKNPTYQQVCTDKTGHAEVVDLNFDPEKVSYEELLEVFWDLHDPTQLNRQGPDVGSQYRSVIFYYSEEQKVKAEESKNKLEASGKYKRDVVTEIVPAKPFYMAEEYHQRYYERHSMDSCVIRSLE